MNIVYFLWKRRAEPRPQNVEQKGRENYRQNPNVEIGDMDQVGVTVKDKISSL